MLGACVGLALAIIGLQLPGWLDKTLSTLGAAAVPTALVASGMAISLAEVRQHAGEVLWISPALAIVLAMGLGMSPMLSIALVLSFGLGTAQMLVPLAENAGQYRTEAAAIVGATTVAMVVVLPVLIWICARLWPGTMLGKLQLAQGQVPPRVRSGAGPPPNARRANGPRPVR